MNKYFKISMFITSFLPLWITIMFKYTFNIIQTETNLYIEKIGIVIILLVISISIFIIYSTINKINRVSYQPYKIISVSQEKGITSEYLLSYILPLFVFDFSVWYGLIEFLIYFLILAFLCIRNDNVYVNLIFECMGYKFYKCSLKWSPEEDIQSIEGIVISKSNLCAFIQNTIDISPLNKPFYINRDLME